MPLLFAVGKHAHVGVKMWLLTRDPHSELLWGPLCGNRGVLRLCKSARQGFLSSVFPVSLLLSPCAPVCVNPILTILSPSLALWLFLSLTLLSFVRVMVPAFISAPSLLLSPTLPTSCALSLLLREVHVSGPVPWPCSLPGACVEAIPRVNCTQAGFLQRESLGSQRPARGPAAPSLLRSKQL